MARLRSTATATVKKSPKTVGAGRQALKEKTNTLRARPAVPQYEDDGDTERLVKEKKGKPGRPRRTAQLSDELMMAGGLALSDDAPEQPSEPQAKTLKLAKSEGPPIETAKPARRPPRTLRKVVPTEAQSKKVMEGLKQRMERTARGERAKQVKPQLPTDIATTSSDTNTANVLDAERPQPTAAEHSESSLSPSPPPAGKLSAVKGRRSSVAIPGSVLRAQNTPAMESSILALKNFRRRPRQPSMLQMVQQRTASARPSLANSALGNTTVEDSGVFDLGLSDDEVDDDFAPEAEGTPLHKAKNKRGSSTSIQRSASRHPSASMNASKFPAKKRKSDEANISSGSLSALKAKRRKAVEDNDKDIEMPPDVAQGVVVPSSSQRKQTPEPLITSDIHVVNSPVTSTPQTDSSSSTRYRDVQEDCYVVPSTEREGNNDEDAGTDDLEMHGTMAEPLSSSPARPDPLVVAPEMADPMSQESAVVMTPKRKKKPRPVFTSALKSLLPKRRQPPRSRGKRSEYDIDSDSDDDTPIDVSHLEDDQDELGSVIRVRTQNLSATTPKTTTGRRGRPPKLASTTTKKHTAASKHAVSSARKGPKTYGRAAASDKENEGYESPEGSEEDSTLPEVSLSMAEVVQSKELEAARNKFAEVDDWDMEFESMSQEFHRSSSQEWR